MTLTLAQQVAQQCADEQGVPFVVWRMPGWTPGAFDVRPKAKGWPDTAEIVETHQPSVPTAAPGMLF